MRKVIFVVLIFFCFMMGLMTYLFFDSENSMFLFSGGSVGSTMEYFGTSKWIVLFLYICIVFSIFFYRKRLKKMLFCFMIFFSLWFLSGRVIGVHYSGEIISGWFYLQTNKVSLWKLDKCSEDIILNTSAEDKFPFYLKFSNECTVNEIYIGPFISSDVKNYFGPKKADRSDISTKLAQICNLSPQSRASNKEK